MIMQTLESTSVTIDGKQFIVVRVPDEILFDIENTEMVLHDAEKRFASGVVLLGLESGQMGGNAADKAVLLAYGFDQTNVRWSEWSMEEEVGDTAANGTENQI
jgi:hypothetical protein